MNNEYKNLTQWCSEYSKKYGVKIYPQSAPLQLVLEDVVGQVNYLQEKMIELQKENIHNINSLMESMKIVKDLLELKEDKKPVKKEVKK